MRYIADKREVTQRLAAGKARMGGVVIIVLGCENCHVPKVGTDELDTVRNVDSAALAHVLVGAARGGPAGAGRWIDDADGFLLM